MFTTIIVIIVIYLYIGAMTLRYVDILDSRTSDKYNICNSDRFFTLCFWPAQVIFIIGDNFYFFVDIFSLGLFKYKV